MAGEKKGKVVRQAAFLMAAQMTSSVIGLLYRSPLHSIMGDVGDGYYQFAYEWYTIILLIASYSIPSAVSKVMAERLAVKEYRNAFKVFKAALIYVLIAGGIGASVAFFGAPYILADEPDAVLALRVLAPTIFLSGFLGVFRGFFQAHNTMKPTAVSQICEQLLNAAFSVFAAYMLAKPYLGDDNLSGKFGAAGGCIGTGAGVLTGFLVMLLAYAMNYRFIHKRLKKDRTQHTETYKEVFGVIFMMCTPIILATCVYNMTSVIDQVIFTRLMTARGMAADAIASLYGLFGYRVKPIINIPIALASATSTALIPAVATSMAEKSVKGAVSKIDECVKMTLFISIPSAVGIGVLSYPVIRILYPSGNVQGASILLSMGAVSVFFYSLSTVMNGVLQGLGHPSVPVRNAAIALAVNAAVTYLTVGFLNIDVYGIVIAAVVYSLTVMLLNSIAIHKYVRYRIKLRQLKAPLISSAVMGVGIGMIYWVPRLLLPGIFDRYLTSAVLCLIAVLLGILIYMVVYNRAAGLTDDEVRSLPMGRKLLIVMKKLHIR